MDEVFTVEDERFGSEDMLVAGGKPNKSVSAMQLGMAAHRMMRASTVGGAKDEKDSPSLPVVPSWLSLSLRRADKPCVDAEAFLCEYIQLEMDLERLSMVTSGRGARGSSWGRGVVGEGTWLPKKDLVWFLSRSSGEAGRGVRVAVLRCMSRASSAVMSMP